MTNDKNFNSYSNGRQTPNDKRQTTNLSLSLSFVVPNSYWPLEIARMMEGMNKWKRKMESHDERLLVLLEDPSGNMEKLRNFVAEANTRRMAMQEKFFAAKAERLEKLGASGNSSSGENNEKMIQMRQGVQALEELLEQKRRIRAKMLKECQKIEGQEQQQRKECIESRNKFVQRILEISAVVAKQNDEIRRTANSVQTIRREIEQLEGTLDRTFTAVNRWMGGGGGGEDGKRGGRGRMAGMERGAADMKMQRTHKMLVRTHEQCALVKEAIQGQGQLSRQINELADRVDLEAQKEVDDQLERLLDDLMMIRGENHEMGKRMAKRTTGADGGTHGEEGETG